MKLLYSGKGNLLSGANEVSLIIYFICLFIVSVLFSSIPFQLSVLGVLIVCTALSASARKMLPFMLYALYFMAIVSVFSIIFGPGMGVIASLGPIAVTYSAVYFSISMLLRIMASIISLNLLLVAVNPDASVAFISRFGKRTAAALLVATRMMPMLANDGEEVLQALESRGLAFRKGRWRKRIAAISHMFFPMLYGTLDRSISVGEAMEVRGFPARWRTRRYAYTWADLFTLSQSGLAVALAILFSLTGSAVANYYSGITISFTLLPVAFALAAIPWGASLRGIFNAGARRAEFQVHIQ